MKNDSKFVLYVGGGVMAGVFGAGVVNALEKNNIYENIEAIYASSAGAVVSSYFLSGQTELGASIFYEDLISDFIRPIYVPLGTYDRFLNKYIKKIPVSNMRNPINIDHVIDVVANKKKLDIEAVKEKQIPFFVHVLNTNTLESEFVEATKEENLLNTLKQAISAVPYYYPHDLNLIDGEIKDPFPIEEIRKRHPDTKIVVILSIMPHRFFRRLMKGILEGAVAALMYSARIWRIYIKRDLGARRKINKALQEKNILIIYPDKKLKLWPNTTNPNKLLSAYAAGREAGQIFIKGNLN